MDPQIFCSHKLRKLRNEYDLLHMDSFENYILQYKNLRFKIDYYHDFFESALRFNIKNNLTAEELIQFIQSMLTTEHSNTNFALDTLMSMDERNLTNTFIFWGDYRFKRKYRHWFHVSYYALKEFNYGSTNILQ